MSSTHSKTGASTGIDVITREGKNLVFELPVSLASGRGRLIGIVLLDGFARRQACVNSVSQNCDVTLPCRTGKPSISNYCGKAGTYYLRSSLIAFRSIKSTRLSAPPPINIAARSKCRSFLIDHAASGKSRPASLARNRPNARYTAARARVHRGRAGSKRFMVGGPPRPAAGSRP